MPQKPNTNREITFRSLWKLLSASERKDAARAFLSSNSDSAEKAKPHVYAGLAIAKGFRPQFLKRRSREDHINYLAASMLNQALARLIDDVLQEYILDRCLGMITTALDAAGIPHKEGLIDDDRAVCPREDLTKGYRSIEQNNSAIDRHLYYGFLVARSSSEYFAEAPAAMEEVGFFELITVGDKAAKDEDSPVSPDEIISEEANEQSDEFVTLDNLLIKTVVATAMEVEGALDPDECEELIDEVIRLNIETRHRFFHRGYAEALFRRSHDFAFQGANEERQSWYLTGILLGLLRNGQITECIALIKEQSSIFDAVCSRRDLHCGRMLLPPFFPILCDAKLYSLLKTLCARHIDFLRPHKRQTRMTALLQEGKALVSKGQPSEALLLLTSINEENDCDDMDPRFVSWLIPQIKRKIGQAHQLQGNFLEATSGLQKALETEQFLNRWNAVADLGLIRGGFRSLSETLPGGEEAQDQSLRQALLEGKSNYDEAVSEYGSEATNAQFVLGLVEFLTPSPVSETSEAAADHFQCALTGMLEQPDTYGEDHLIIWTRFFLAICILETGNQGRFQRARDYVQQARDSPVSLPLPLWERCCRAAALYEDSDLAEETAEFLLQHRGKRAYPLLKESDLLRGNGRMRDRYREWILGQQLPSQELWIELVQLLKFANEDRIANEAADILDVLQEHAEKTRKLSPQFLSLLEDSSLYEPGWNSEDADDAKLHLYELNGQLEELRGLLESKFYIKRTSGSPENNEESLQILNWLQDLNTEPETVKRLEDSIPEEAPDEIEEAKTVESRLREGAPVTIFVIGGNEVQERMETSIRKKLSRYPGLTLRFHYPGWTSNWNVHLKRVLGNMEGVDAIVLSYLVRTTFGKKLREHSNEIAPWFPSTGKGRGSIERSIIAAAKWAVTDRASETPPR